MVDDYELVEHELAEGVKVFCLATRASEKDFVDKWGLDAGQQESFERFVSVVKRIGERGPLVMAKTQRLRCIDGNLGLYEIKNFYKAMRVMAVIRQNTVLLFRYEAHKGGAGNNDPKMMKRARQRAKTACELLEKELGEGYGN